VQPLRQILRPPLLQVPQADVVQVSELANHVTPAALRQRACQSFVADGVDQQLMYPLIRPPGLQHLSHEVVHPDLPSDRPVPTKKPNPSRPTEGARHFSVPVPTRVPGTFHGPVSQVPGTFSAPPAPESPRAVSQVPGTFSAPRPRSRREPYRRCQAPFQHPGPGIAESRNEVPGTFSAPRQCRREPTGARRPLPPASAEDFGGLVREEGGGSRAGMLEIVQVRAWAGVPAGGG